MYLVSFKEKVKDEDLYPQTITCFNAEIALSLAAFIQRASNEPSGTVAYLDITVEPLRSTNNEKKS